MIVYPIYAILFLSGSKREPAQLYFTKGETAYEACTEKRGCHRHLLPLDRPRAGSHSGGYPLSGKSRIPDQAGPSMRETGFLPAGSGSTRDGRKSRSLRPEPRAGGLLPADPPVGRAVWVKLAPAAEVVGTPRQQFVCPPGPGIEMRRIRNRFGIEGGEHPFPLQPPLENQLPVGHEEDPEIPMAQRRAFPPGRRQGGDETGEPVFGRFRKAGAQGRVGFRGAHRAAAVGRGCAKCWPPGSRRDCPQN